MFPTTNSQRRWNPLLGARTLLAVLVAAMVQPGFAEKPQESGFDSANQAVTALYHAVETDDQTTIRRLLGPLASSNDFAQDKADRERFVEKYSEMHRLIRRPDGTAVLYIGAENWPFPVPLVSDHGKWRFDTDAGTQEVMFRSVGANEMNAIDACRAMVHPDKATGNAAVDGYVRKLAGANPPSEPFQGYYFRILRTSAGPVAIAYPAEYGVTGVMTFAATSSDTVYEKDLGPKTAGIARTMTQYEPGRTWRLAE